MRSRVFSKMQQRSTKGRRQNTHLTGVLRASLTGYTQLFLMEKEQLQGHIFLVFTL